MDESYVAISNTLVAPSTAWEPGSCRGTEAVFFPARGVGPRMADFESFEELPDLLARMAGKELPS